MISSLVILIIILLFVLVVPEKILGLFQNVEGKYKCNGLCYKEGKLLNGSHPLIVPNGTEYDTLKFNGSFLINDIYIPSNNFREKEVYFSIPGMENRFKGNSTKIDVAGKITKNQAVFEELFFDRFNGYTKFVTGTIPEPVLCKVNCNKIT
jgi:hypothetical protein